MKPSPAAAFATIQRAASAAGAQVPMSRAPDTDTRPTDRKPGSIAPWSEAAARVGCAPCGTSLTLSHRSASALEYSVGRSVRATTPAMLVTEGVAANALSEP